MAKDFAKAFYKSKAWQDTREYVMKRDKYRCQDCGAIAEEVHHIKELTKENINDIMVTVNPKNLVSLCYRCHKIRHKKKEKEAFKVCYSFDDEGNIIPPGDH